MIAARLQPGAETLTVEDVPDLLAVEENYQRRGRSPIAPGRTEAVMAANAESAERAGLA